MKPSVESLQAIGIDIWLPLGAAQAEMKQYGLISRLEANACLVLITAEDYQDWQKLQELLSNILKWQKMEPGSYCLGFLNENENAKSHSLQDLIEQIRPKAIISFGLPLRLELDSLSGIRYVETLRLIDILDNVENKRRVMNDFAGFSL